MSSAPGLFVERFQVVEGFPAVNQQTATNPGDWVSMKNYGALHVIAMSAPAATATGAMVIRMEQATDVAGTSAKALDFTTIHRKMAATNLATIPLFTLATQTATNTYTINTATEGDRASIVVLSFTAEQLDTENGFDCVRAQIDKTGGTQPKLGTLLYILETPRYAPPLTAISD